MYELKKWATSVVGIVILFICFWPLGCVFLYMRWAQTKGKFSAITKTLLVCGVGLVIFGFTGIIVSIDSNDAQVAALALLLFIIPGIIMALLGGKRRKKLQEYNIYLEYINARKKVELDTLCNQLNVAPDVATSSLTDMINKGIIKGYLTDNELILNNGYDDFQDELTYENPEFEEIKIVKCKECGAKNTVTVGTTRECEYCGTILQ